MPTARRNLRVSRATTVALGHSSRSALGITFEKQNIAFMVSLAFAVAASANFPVLFHERAVEGLHHPRRGGPAAPRPDFVGRPDHRLTVGLGSHARLPQGLGLVSLHLAGAVLDGDRLLFGIWLFSVLDRSAPGGHGARRFEAQQVRSETGLARRGRRGTEVEPPKRFTARRQGPAGPGQAPSTARPKPGRASFFRPDRDPTQSLRREGSAISFEMRDNRI